MSPYVPSLPYLCSSHKISLQSREALLGTVDEQFKLEHGLEVALQALKAGNAIEAIPLLGIYPCEHNCVKPGIPCSGAHKVFGITEILELILREFSTAELLSAQRVNNRMRDVIDGSKDLMQRLFLLPGYGSHIDVLSTAGFDGNFMRQTRNIRISNTCYVRPNKAQNDQSNGRLYLEVEVLFDQPLPRVGSRIRQMFITQPPAKSFTMAINCCDPDDRELLGAEPLPAVQITNPAGVTIGELYDEAQRAMQQHINCPFADWRNHTASGAVDLKITFKAQLNLPANHPRSIQCESEQQKEDEEHERLKPGRKLRREFCKAKAQGEFYYAPTGITLNRMRCPQLLPRLTLDAAYTQGNPIPTFEQFKSSTADKEASSFETVSQEH
ncbi:hypothetical protein LTR56_003886 [Elasticomyces elasticus]|nr:hypothetical protein LTR22_022561 [Elasticomyces elasticus]KAK3654613.1 hypothetical protein LTR56_003886 [Elasticomyces elasticus]KAK4908007.1 hypothetical protein LTR49_023038 [Elasticomyces elasticus]KAK5755241.1 hypothetical protein LTS12_014691 [Elasticomyces elasticus]